MQGKSIWRRESPVEAVTYRMKPLSKSLEIILIALTTIPTSYTVYRMYVFDWEEFGILLSEPDSGLLIIVLGIISISVVALILFLIFFFKQQLKPGPEFNFLQIDQSGLNYVRHGKSRFWAWNELSGFRMVSRFSRIEFALPFVDPKAVKSDPWVHGVTPRGPYVVINDAYDASLDEIVATLNAYRQQAIG